jgi:DNA-binding IclR family transcriptional regulator
MPRPPRPDQIVPAGSVHRQNHSVHKAAALLRAAARNGSGSTVSALARAAELPRATALRTIESLISEHFLARLPDGRVVIGSGLDTIARNTSLAEPLLDSARLPMDQLAGRTEESVILTVNLPDGALSVVRQVDGPHLLGLTSCVGRRLALHAYGSGKLALAFGSTDRVEALLRTRLPPLAARTLTQPDALRSELDQIRAAGWAQDEDEGEDGLASVAVGVAFPDVLVGCLSVSGPTTRFGEQARMAVLPALTRAGRAVAHNLGATCTAH